jgi:GABA(A) receptor-associated protein
MEQFKNNTSLDKRQCESARMCTKHPERVPVIVCKYKGDIGIPEIDKQKYLVPKEMTIGQFIYVIRKRIKLEPDQALFVLVNNSLQPTIKLMDDIYTSGKDEDGFLYVIYSSENTFG